MPIRTYAEHTPCILPPRQRNTHNVDSPLVPTRTPGVRSAALQYANENTSRRGRPVHTSLWHENSASEENCEAEVQETLTLPPQQIIKGAPSFKKPAVYRGSPYSQHSPLSPPTPRRKSSATPLADQSTHAQPRQSRGTYSLRVCPPQHKPSALHTHVTPLPCQTSSGWPTLSTLTQAQSTQSRSHNSSAYATQPPSEDALSVLSVAYQCVAPSYLWG
jgi:hypothetical protein